MKGTRIIIGITMKGTHDLNNAKKSERGVGIE